MHKRKKEKKDDQWTRKRDMDDTEEGRGDYWMNAWRCGEKG